ncbi:solute carrier family 2, facilitated glucose transporter member 8-like [Octopus vulgaris]|uniref:Solute carrier family 2, facilitated glucose transporter member 8-like n=1 Tax=Octopus vulgaris TaxID=6645 RepID=A0AA36FCK3_OCTVU|nr:solute carrier family 2, facilitated glucose transporter member 8-like [Octopus vulgaris]
MFSERLHRKHLSVSRQFITSCLAAFLGPFSFGYILGYSSPAIAELLKSKFLHEQQAAWFGSMVTIGAMLGGPIAGWFVEKHGRKYTMNFISVPLIVGWCLLIATSNVILFYLSRIVSGIAIGMTCVVSPIYIAEISTRSLRGMLGSSVQLSITVGIFVAYILGMYMDYIQMAKFGILFPFLSLFFTLSMPETPRWLLYKGRRVEAIQALTKLRSVNCDVEDEIRDIEEGLDVQDISYRDMWRKPELSRPIFISLSLMILQQLTGINAVLFYAVPIFKESGYENQSYLASAIIGATQILFTFFVSQIMDRVGRRKLLICGGLILSFSCFVLGSYYALKEHNYLVANNLKTLPLISLVVFIASFSIGWGPIPMLIMSEIFPSHARGKASALSIFTSWLFAFIVTKEFITVKESLGPAETFWLFSVFSFAGVFFVWFVLPETKGKSLEEIELYFLGRSMLKK